MSLQISLVAEGRFDSFYYGKVKTDFGDCLVAFYEDVVLGLHFLLQSDGEESFLLDLKERWPESSILKNQQKAQQFLNSFLGGESEGRRYFVHVKGTEFQKAVWNGLLTLPRGPTISYQDFAQKIDRPNSVRAVAHAIASNRVALFIPCHRVVKKGGEIGQYRWGSDLKQRILAWERRA